jgi:hypothetical protein
MHVRVHPFICSVTQRDIKMPGAKKKTSDENRGTPKSHEGDVNNRNRMKAMSSNEIA